MDKLQDTECCSAFWFKINKWRKFKNRFNRYTVILSGRIIKTSIGTYINTYTYHVSGNNARFATKIRDGFDESIIKNYLNEIIKKFQEEHSCILDESTILEIEKDFIDGINVYEPGVKYMRE
jgi:hypothetical protein